MHLPFSPPQPALMERKNVAEPISITNAMNPIRISAGPINPITKVSEIRVLIGHVMENGFRSDETGKRIPINIIKEIIVSFNNEIVFSAELGTGIAANPLLSFPLLIPQGGGILRAVWRDDRGQSGQLNKEVGTQ